MEKSGATTFSNRQYSIVVLQCLKRALRRSAWIQETIIPRNIDHDSPDTHEIIEALEYAIDAVKSQKTE